jgi:hypothetical protein
MRIKVAHLLFPTREITNRGIEPREGDVAITLTIVSRCRCRDRTRSRDPRVQSWLAVLSSVE